ALLSARLPSAPTGTPLTLTERFLLPPNIDEAQRQAIVHKRLRRCHSVSGRVIAVFPGERWMGATARQCRWDHFTSTLLPTGHFTVSIPISVGGVLRHPHAVFHEHPAQAHTTTWACVMRVPALG